MVLRKNCIGMSMTYEWIIARATEVVVLTQVACPLSDRFTSSVQQCSTHAHTQALTWASAQTVAWLDRGLVRAAMHQHPTCMIRPEWQGPDGVTFPYIWIPALALNTTRKRTCMCLFPDAFSSHVFFPLPHQLYLCLSFSQKMTYLFMLTLSSLRCYPSLMLTLIKIIKKKGLASFFLGNGYCIYFMLKL
jgi:hypothetical protein